MVCDWCLVKIIGEKCEFLYLFVIGGVGIGKSYFIKVINYEVLCLFLRVMFDLERILVVFVVFIGMVVFNIGGNIFYYVFLLLKYFLLFYELFGE